MGLGTVEKDAMQAHLEELGVVTGQKPVVTRARKSISNFKLREGMSVGAKVTLRYDPLAPPRRPLQVWHEGRQIQLARPVDLAANCLVKRHSSAPAGLKLHELGDADAKENR